MAVENPVFRLFPVFVFFTCYGIIVERIASGYTGLLLDCGCLWIYGYYNSLVFFFFFLEDSSIQSINKTNGFGVTKFFANDSRVSKRKLFIHISLLAVLIFISVIKVEPVEREDNIASMQERYENSVYIQNIKNNTFLLILVHSCTFILACNS